MTRKKRERRPKLQDRHPGLRSPRAAQVAAEESIDKLFEQTSRWVAQWLHMQPKMPTEAEIMEQVDLALDQIFGKDLHDGPASPYGQLLVSAVRKGQEDFLREQSNTTIALAGERPVKASVAHARKALALRAAKGPA